MSARSFIVKEISALWEEGKGTSLVVIAGGWGVLLGIRMIFPVLLPYFRQSFDLSLTIAGLLITILWIGAAIGQLPGGILADRYSERSIMAVSAISVGLALVVVVLAPTPLVLFVGTGLVGIGQSFYPIARITMLSYIYPDRIGSALGMTMATGDLGQTVLPPIAGVLATTIAWKVGLGFVIPMLLLAAIGLIYTLPKNDPVANTVDPLSAETARYLLAELQRSNLLFVSLILFLYFLTWQSFTALYPTYLVDVKGLSPSAAGLLYSAFFAFGIVIKPLAGAAYDRIGIRKALIIVLVGPVGGLVLLPFTEGFWPLVVITAVISTMLGSGAINQSFLSDSFAEDIRGTGLGVVRTPVSTLGALGPVFFGGIADRGYFDEGYMLLAAILVAVILLAFRIPVSPR